MLPRSLFGLLLGLFLCQNALAQTRSATLVLGPQTHGRFSVFAGEQQVLSLEKEFGKTLELGLEPGVYLLIVEQNGTRFKSRVTLKAGDRTPPGGFVPFSVPFPKQAPQITPPTPPTPPIPLSPPPTPEPKTEPPATTGPGSAGIVPTGSSLIDPEPAVTRPVSTASTAHAGTSIRGVGTVTPLGARNKTAPSTGRLSWAPVSISILPFLSTNSFYSRPVKTSLSLNLLMGQTTQLEGLELGFGINRVKRSATGFQGALVANTVGGPMRGIQVSLATNLGFETVTGLQGSLGLNYAGGLMKFGQLALGLNIAAKGAFGLQASFGGNYAAGELRGGQLSMLYNQAGKVSGLQVGTLNLSDEHRGLQIGLLNISRKLRGVQLGLINIAEEADVSLGMFNFIKNGLLHLDAWSDETGMIQFGLRFGSRYTYTILTGGTDVVRDRQRWSAGLGWGIHVPFKERFYFNVDVIGQVVQRGLRFQKQSTAMLNQARLIVGLRIFKHLGIFGGATANAMLAHEDHRTIDTLIPSFAYRRSGGTQLSVWPGFVLGLQI